MTVIVLSYVLTAWWVFYRLLRLELWQHPVAFLPVLLTTLSPYLLYAFVLPDVRREDAAFFVETAAGERRLDLHAFYFSASHRRWFFGTAAAFGLLFFAVFNAGQYYVGRPLSSAVTNTLLAVPGFILPHLLLIATTRTWVHVVATLYSAGWAGFLLFDVAVALSM